MEHWGFIPYDSFMAIPTSVRFRLVDWKYSLEKERNKKRNS